MLYNTNPPVLCFRLLDSTENIDPPMVAAVPASMGDGSYGALEAELATVPVSSPAPAVTSTTTTSATYTIPASSNGNVNAQHHSTTSTMGIGRKSVSFVCPFCRAQMVTRTKTQIGGVTVIAVVLLLLLFWPLFWLPLCLPSCKTTNHYCSSCNRCIAKADPCS